jgi:hypothetical protein
LNVGNIPSQELKNRNLKKLAFLGLSEKYDYFNQFLSKKKKLFFYDILVFRWAI